MINGLFDIQIRLDKIDRNGDPLNILAKLIDWESFRPHIDHMREKDRKSTAGRKPVDAVIRELLIAQNRFYYSGN